MNEYTNPDPYHNLMQKEGPLEKKWFYAILSSLGDGVIATNTEGQVTFLNPAGQLVIGWTQDEVPGTSLEEVFALISEVTRQPIANPVTHVLRGESVVDLPQGTLLLSKDGREIPIAGRAAPIRNGAGEIIGAVLVFRDVGKAWQAETVVREAREYAENIVNTVRHPLLILDRNLRVQTAIARFTASFMSRPRRPNINPSLISGMRSGTSPSYANCSRTFSPRTPRLTTLTWSMTSLPLAVATCGLLLTHEYRVITV